MSSTQNRCSAAARMGAKTVARVSALMARRWYTRYAKAMPAKATTTAVGVSQPSSSNSARGCQKAKRMPMPTERRARIHKGAAMNGGASCP